MVVNGLQSIQQIKSYNFNKKIVNDKIKKVDKAEISMGKIDVIKQKINDGYYETDEFNNLLVEKLMKNLDLFR